MVRRLLNVACLALLGCDAPARGEALFVVDTDMPIPKIVDHLRVDVYTGDGSRWLISRDIAAARLTDWPLSFSIYTDDMDVGASALVRLRGYHSGYVDDYQGEGLLQLPPLGTSSGKFDQCCTMDCASLCRTYWSPTPDCPQNCPRLIEDTGDGGSIDVTPKAEPQPLVTIDRLVLVDLVPGVRGKVSVLLAGACAGTQAVLPDPTRSNPSPSDIQTCVDTERTLAPVTASVLDPDMSYPPPGTTVQGTFESPFATACAPARQPTRNLYDDQVCVPGGVMIFGDNHGINALPYPSQPRIAAVPSFLMDVYELSVGRFRALVAKGFQMPGGVAFNDGPLNTGNVMIGTTADCTGYSDPAWSGVDRDAKPLNCVGYAAARTLCQELGGDLPTEAQWEYAAADVGRLEKNYLTFPTPMGPLPQCGDVAFARANIVAVPTESECFESGQTSYGVANVDYGNDVAGGTAGRLFGMSGNLTELTLDAAASMVANCWLSAPIASPSCAQPNPPMVVTRGAYFYATAETTTTATRGGFAASMRYIQGGFRCAY